VQKRGSPAPGDTGFFIVQLQGEQRAHENFAMKIRTAIEVLVSGFGCSSGGWGWFPTR
jgi:hypothetical protein